MPDRESVITHLQIIHIWAEFARERDLQFFTPKHLEDIAKWSDDALALLQEQEAKPLRCKKCNYHRDDGWCNEHRREVQESDYCSFGAWEGR